MSLAREQLIAKAATRCARYPSPWLNDLIRVGFDLEHAPALPVLALQARRSPARGAFHPYKE